MENNMYDFSAMRKTKQLRMLGCYIDLNKVNDMLNKSEEKNINKTQATGKELDELIEEHKELVNVLESPSHTDDKKEAEKQKEELDEYKDLKKAYEILGLDNENK